MTGAARSAIANRNLVLLAATSSASLGLVGYQWLSLGALEMRDIPGLSGYALLFLSPYAGLAGLSVWLGRDRPPALVVSAGSALTAAWGLFWLLDVLVLRPDTVAGLLLVLLVVGPQWTGVAVTGMMAAIVRLVWRRRIRDDPGASAETRTSGDQPIPDDKAGR